jgi:hypothetical protein
LPPLDPELELEAFPELPLEQATSQTAIAPNRSCPADLCRAMWILTPPWPRSLASLRSV